MEEIVQNYVIGTIQGTFKTKRYWVKKGYNKDHAIKNAIEYGIGQLAAGVGKTCDAKTAVTIFREIAEIANAYANKLEEVFLLEN
jgi:urocanate hydratase